MDFVDVGKKLSAASAARAGGPVRAPPGIAACGLPGPPAPSSATGEKRVKSREELERANEELERGNEVLEERISMLSAAVLRLGSSLDLATVLQEAADSARALWSSPSRRPS